MYGSLEEETLFRRCDSLARNHCWLKRQTRLRGKEHLRVNRLETLNAESDKLG